MNPNLTTTTTFSFKDILLRKLSYAVACSVIAHLFILVLYIFIANINVLHPVEWMSSTLDAFMYVSTWFFLLIFISIIFAQCLICSKDYVLMSSYCSTRFQQFLHIFSAHNFILLALHVVIGGVIVWEILTVVDGRDLITTEDRHHCLVSDTFFLILGGFWTGLYFFLRVYISSKHLVFPVIQQRKFLRFRSHVAPLFKESLNLSVWPAVYFAAFYYVWGHQLEEQFMSVVGVDKAVTRSGVMVYLYSWWFATLYFFSMNLMRFFFYLFLTESVEFPLVKENPNVLTLQEAIAINSMPIIQNLACLDLFSLAQWSPVRRQIFFTLSQPGCHPHNWNTLVESVLKLFSEYTDTLKKSTEHPMLQDKMKQLNVQEVLSPSQPSVLQSPVNPYLKFRNLRNMSLYSDNLDIVSVSHNIPSGGGLESLQKKLQEKFDKFVAVLKIVLGINYFFGELPQANIQKCLGNGHLIIWASQGVSELLAASLTEDKYGIVQKDLPVILSTLVQLKLNLDKLNKVAALSRRVASLDDFNYKMKNAVSAAVKRSLFDICLHFGQYFHEFSLGKDVLQYLQTNVMLNNCS